MRIGTDGKQSGWVDSGHVGWKIRCSGGRGRGRDGNGKQRQQQEEVVARSGWPRRRRSESNAQVPAITNYRLRSTDTTDCGRRQGASLEEWPPVKKMESNVVVDCTTLQFEINMCSISDSQKRSGSYSMSFTAGGLGWQLEQRSMRYMCTECSASLPCDRQIRSTGFKRLRC